MKHIAYWALGIAVVACVAVTAISFFAARALTHHRSSRPSVTPADSGLTYQVVPLKARDGTVLEGWWIIPKDGVRRRDLATVVLAHAADGEIRGALTGKAGMLRHAAWLSRAGFIVLAFDFRSYGGSKGEETTGGDMEQQDLEAALRLVRERAIGAPVAVMGEGMGAYVGLLITAQDRRIVGLVADSPTRSRIEGLYAAAPLWTRIAVPNHKLLEEWAHPQGTFTRLLSWAGRSPVMLIEDSGAAEIDAAKAALGPGNASWVLEAAPGRLRAFNRDAGTYRRRVEEFLEAAIERSDSTSNVAPEHHS